MNNDKKNHIENEPSDISEKQPLSDQELERASGGFTLIDTCQNRWAPLICMAPWGACPHLNIKETGKRVGNFNNVIYYLVSCNKGCFKDTPYEDYLD